MPSLRVLPHFDVYAKWIPDLVMRPLLSSGATVVGIDEQTSLQAEPPEDPNEPWQFRGVGRGSCWRIEPTANIESTRPLLSPLPSIELIDRWGHAR